MDLPIACTLGERSFAERRERWERLMDRSLVDRRPHERGMVLRFREDPGAAGELAAWSISNVTAAASPSGPSIRRAATAS